MTTPPKTQTATASLVAALAELDNVKANKINPAFKAKYVSLDALLDANRSMLVTKLVQFAAAKSMGKPIIRAWSFPAVSRICNGVAM